jgi:hypothetical protein
MNLSRLTCFRMGSSFPRVCNQKGRIGGCEAKRRLGDGRGRAPSFVGDGGGKAEQRAGLFPAKQWFMDRSRRLGKVRGPASWGMGGRHPVGAVVALGFVLSLACASNDAKHDTFSAGLDSGAASTLASDASVPSDDGRSVQAEPSLLSDGATVDVRCAPLDILILGNPGSNPSSNFQQWLMNGGATVERMQTATLSPTITAATLQPFDVVILDQLTRDYSTAEAAILASWVSDGGGIVSLSGYQDDPTIDWRANSLLAPLSLAYSGTLMDGPVTQFAVHPITAGITSITFDGGYGIADLGGAAGTRTPIAFLPDATAGAGAVPVGYAVQFGGGRAFVWGDEWIEFDSAWSMLPQIKQLWVQVLGWLAPGGNCVLQPLQ